MLWKITQATSLFSCQTSSFFRYPWLASFVWEQTTSSQIIPTLRQTRRSTTTTTTLNTIVSCKSASFSSQQLHEQERRTTAGQRNPREGKQDARWREMWRKWTSERPVHPRWSASWWWDAFIICTVFAITGSSSLFCVRPILQKIFGLEGSMREGPWSYRILSLGLLMPVYSMMLVCIGTLFGRHAYFKTVSLRIWGRFLPFRRRKQLNQ